MNLPIALPPLKRVLLLPVEKLYEFWMVRRRAWYMAHPEKRYRAPIPVISVGNISAGGTGKTPMAIWLLEHYLAQGKTPAYLSRGYGRKTSGYLQVSPGHRSRDVGDEALMVALRFPNLPIAVCESRTKGIQRLLETHHPDLIILDDAFQHLKVHRDLDLLLMDATRMPDQDYLLPGGRLREPLFALTHADALIVNKLPSELEWNQLSLRLAPWAKPIAGSSMKVTTLLDTKGTKHSPDTIQGKKAVLFSGLANNDSFHALVTSLGAEVIEHQTYPDHYAYRPGDFAAIAAMLNRNPEAIVLTTEKDLARSREDLPAEIAARLHAVVIGLSWMGEGMTNILSQLPLPSAQPDRLP